MDKLRSVAIVHVASRIADGYETRDQMREINAGEGFTIEYGNTPTGGWYRSEGVQLSDEDLERAFLIARGWPQFLRDSAAPEAEDWWLDAPIEKLRGYASKVS